MSEIEKLITNIDMALSTLPETVSWQSNDDQIALEIDGGAPQTEGFVITTFEVLPDDWQLFGSKQAASEAIRLIAEKWKCSMRWQGQVLQIRKPSE